MRKPNKNYQREVKLAGHELFLVIHFLKDFFTSSCRPGRSLIWLIWLLAACRLVKEGRLDTRPPREVNLQLQVRQCADGDDPDLFEESRRWVREWRWEKTSCWSQREERSLLDRLSLISASLSQSVVRDEHRDGLKMGMQSKDKGMTARVVWLTCSSFR